MIQSVTFIIIRLRAPVCFLLRSSFFWNEYVCCWRNQFRNHCWHLSIAALSVKLWNLTMEHWLVWLSLKIPPKSTCYAKLLMFVCFHLYGKWLVLENCINVCFYSVHQGHVVDKQPGGYPTQLTVPSIFVHRSFIIYSVSTNNYGNHEKCLSEIWAERLNPFFV